MRIVHLLRFSVSTALWCGLRLKRSSISLYASLRIFLSSRTLLRYCCGYYLVPFKGGDDRTLFPVVVDSRHTIEDVRCLAECIVDIMYSKRPSLKYDRWCIAARTSDLVQMKVPQEVFIFIKKTSTDVCIIICWRKMMIVAVVRIHTFQSNSWRWTVMIRWLQLYLQTCAIRAWYSC